MSGQGSLAPIWQSCWAGLEAFACCLYNKNCYFRTDHQNCFWYRLCGFMLFLHLQVGNISSFLISSSLLSAYSCYAEVSEAVKMWKCVELCRKNLRRWRFMSCGTLEWHEAFNDPGKLICLTNPKNCQMEYDSAINRQFVTCRMQELSLSVRPSSPESNNTENLCSFRIWPKPCVEYTTSWEHSCRLLLNRNVSRSRIK